MSRSKSQTALFIVILLYFSHSLCIVIVVNHQDAPPITMTTPKDDEREEVEVSSTPPHPQLFVRQSDPLPPPINGTLRLVFLSDTHGQHDEIPLPLPHGDVLFHLGDACNKGSIEEMSSFVKWMKKNSFHKERIVIDGNHDRDRIPMEGRKRDYMAGYKGVARVLRNELVEVADGKLAVAGVTWNACESENFTKAKNRINAWNESIMGEEKKRVDLVLSHIPPYVKGGGRGWRGSGVLSAFVKDVNPPLHCFGHIHWARGVRAFDSDITMVNCATTYKEPVVIDYCPLEKRALMIHCPIPDESLMHINSSKFPRQWLMA